jgi:G:T-mismatch repair DNA endonuclease (very short patch repair protein)
MTEAHIEKKVCDHAKRHGWLVYKFQSPSQRGVPDRIFLKKRLAMFMEFKAPGKRPTKQQLATHQKFRDQGFHVYVVDDIDVGKRLLEIDVEKVI